MRDRLGWLASMTAALLLAAPLPAQTPTGGVEGVVTDASGAGIADARVTLSEPALGLIVSLTSGQQGHYSARNLVPGTYRVRVEASGFSSKELVGLEVNVGGLVRGDVRLSVGLITETVLVQADALTVDTSRQTVDSVVTELELRSLPSFGRNFLDFAALAPGTLVRDGDAIDPTKGLAYRAVGIAGRSGTGTRIQIDGIDVTDETVGTTVANISTEAVREFQLTRSSLDISTSLTSSGAISIISKQGGNSVQGSAFHDFTNQDLRARPQYAPTQPASSRRRGGFGLGGPFVQDRLFWFANLERTWETRQQVESIPDFGLASLTQGFPVRLQYGLARADWNVREDLRLFYKFQHSGDLATGGKAGSPFQNVNWTNTHAGGLNASSARWTHAYRIGHTNFNNRIESQELDRRFPVAPDGTPYYLGVGPLGMGPNSLAPQQTYQDTTQNSYDGSVALGAHTLRFGGSHNRIVLGGFANFAGPLSVTGQYDADTLERLREQGQDARDPLSFPLQSFTLGPATGFFTLAPAHNLPHGGRRNQRVAFFAGDSWKLARTFTLNLGLRWLYDSRYFADPAVRREPALERFLPGASEFPRSPKNLYSPSVGFAWDPTGRGRTAIRGGFYRAFEMNIFNNVFFDEFSQLPPGIGPDTYDITGVRGPDGMPITLGGRFPNGDYQAFVGRPLREVIGLVAEVNAALQAAYRGHRFDPASGRSTFVNLRGNTLGGQVPGNQFKAPYGLQFNLGAQHEVAPGTVLSADYLQNNGVGLPFLLQDFERRRDASTLNVANALAQVGSVLNGRSVESFLVANPAATIATFRLLTDDIFQGATPDFLRARFFQGGFTRYRAVHMNLRGQSPGAGPLRNLTYNLSYAFGRGESTAAADRAEFISGPLDNLRPNSRATFGPTPLDITHLLTGSLVGRLPFGLEVDPLVQFRTPRAQTLTVPNLGGAISGVNGFFGTDLNGDGGVSTTPRADVLPGTRAGDLGRRLTSFAEVNRVIAAFNDAYAGRLTPHGQALVSGGVFTAEQLRRLGAVVPSIPLIPAGNPDPFHNLLTVDIRIARPFRLGENRLLRLYVEAYNLFNHAPPGTYGGLSGRFGALNYDYANAPEGLRASDLDASRGRLADTRRWVLGLRVDF